MQFSSYVSVFVRRCQFEILIVPESFQKDWHFVDHHLMELWRVCCFFRRNYCREQRFENFAMSFDLLLKEVADLWINWDRFSCHISQKIIHRNQWLVMHLTFPAGMLVKRDMADVHSVSGVLYNLSSLFEFRPDWPPNETHGKQNAPSRNLEYASQGNLFSQPLTKWRLEFEHSTDTGKSNSLPGFKHIPCELELVLVRIRADFLEN